MPDRSNQLADETSPYLLQHKDNPVDWLPWGEEAKRLASERDVPLLVSIGYSACHWCHVMERESFEDEATAAYMNEHFVSVKVDREERPDVDAIYMEALQGMTGSGGWPLTAFCDPEGVPFHCGTYFPPEPRQGMPSFRQVLEAVLEAWSGQRREIAEASERTRERLGAIGRLPPTAEVLGEELLGPATSRLLELADRAHGGFGGAPKFPPASALDLLLARGEHEHVRRTLLAMADGGIHDQLGGGFARYSVDGRWLVPHFEKMLYDNALLIRAYLHGWQELGEQRFLDVAASTADWAIREMRGPEGGFYSALDADSEGVEGLFYTWTLEEAHAALAEAGFGAEEAAAASAHLGITALGHLEGRSVLHRGGAPPPPRVEEARRALLAARSSRVRPGTDDKRLCSWNALMAGALAELGAVSGEPAYVEAATGCISFLLAEMRDDRGRLLRTYNRGQARLAAYLEDHAYLLEALLRAYEATFDPRWYREARTVAETMIVHFADPVHGGFFTTADDHEELIARRKDIDDHPTPSGNASAALGLLRLAALSGESRYEQLAVGVLELLGGAAGTQPQGLAYLLTAADFHAAPTREVALLTPASDPEASAEMATAIRTRYRPHVVVAGGIEGSTEPELLAERPALDGGPAAYVCERFTCKAPVGSVTELEPLLADAGGERPGI